MAENTSTVRQHRETATRQRQVEKPAGPDHSASQVNQLDLQMAMNDPASVSPGTILALQRLAGNQAVSRLIQAKLTVGAADDPYEREADQMATTVLNMPEPLSPQASPNKGQPLQREAEEEEELQAKPLAESISRLVQREAVDEEELQAKSDLQRQAEEDEEVQAKTDLQRQAEEEELQMKPVLQRAPEEEEEVQMKPGGQRFDPRESFDAGADVEAQIKAQKGGGVTLPSDLRGSLETRFGADFSQVRVHNDGPSAQLNRALSAQAFTHGSDIFMGEGRYQPDSASGQQLLAHELTHTIQQGASPVGAMRKPSPPNPSGAGLQASRTIQSGMLQLKLAVVSSKAHTRLVNAAPTGTPKQQDRLVDKSPMGSLLKKGDPIDLSDTATEHIQDASYNILWYRTTKANTREYVRGEKVVVTEAPTGGQVSNPEGEDLLGAVKENLIGTISEGLGDFSGEIGDSVSDLVKKQKNGDTLTDAELVKLNKAQGQTTKLDTASSVFSTGGGILGMALALKSLSGEGDFKAKVDAAFNLLISGTDTVGSLSSFSSNVTKSSKVADHAGAASKWSESLSGMFGTIQKGISTIVNVVQVIKMVADSKQYSRDEYFQKGSELLSNALETAKGVVGSIKSIYDAIGDVASSVLETVAVGLDIALNAIKSVMQGYYLAVSARQWYLMSQRGKELTQGLAGDEQKQADLKQATGVYTHNEAMIAKIDEQIKKDQAIIDKNNLAIQNLRANGAPTAKQQKKIDDLLQKNQTLTTRIDGYNLKKQEHQKQITDYEQAHSDMTREKLEEHGLVAELGLTNRKRVVRQSIHITSNLIKIAGGIANLTGVGATAGVALKASAAGIDISLPFFRAIKQFGRNLAAKNLARGETGISNKIFNADKSTVAKMEKRKGHALVILKLTAKLADYLPKDSDPVKRAQEEAVLKRHIAQVEGYIRASGCDPVVLYRANGNPQEQIKILVKELSRREFGSD